MNHRVNEPYSSLRGDNGLHCAYLGFLHNNIVAPRIPCQRRNNYIQAAMSRERNSNVTRDLKNLFSHVICILYMRTRVLCFIFLFKSEEQTYLYILSLSIMPCFVVSSIRKRLRKESLIAHLNNEEASKKGRERFSLPNFHEIIKIHWWHM